MNVLTPIAITDAMIGAGTTIAEPAASETAWVSGGTYAVGDLRIRTTTHKVYSCVQAHTGRTALPENDAAYWLEKSPTNRYAPFDIYNTTAATATTSITYVLSPGYFNAISLYGLVGSTISITLKDAPAGTTIWSYSGSLYRDPLGWYEYLFGGLQQIDRLQFHDLPIRPTAELAITLSASSGQPVGIGMINVGDRISLGGGDANWGGTQYGSTRSHDPFRKAPETRRATAAFPWRKDIKNTRACGCFSGSATNSPSADSSRSRPSSLRRPART
jgi:hypothetical protein